MYEWTIRYTGNEIESSTKGVIDHTVYADTSDEAMAKVLKAVGADETGRGNFQFVSMREILEARQEIVQIPGHHKGCSCMWCNMERERQVSEILGKLKDHVPGTVKEEKTPAPHWPTDVPEEKEGICLRCGDSYGKKTHKTSIICQRCALRPRNRDETGVGEKRELDLGELARMDRVSLTAFAVKNGIAFSQSLNEPLLSERDMRDKIMDTLKARGYKTI